jgi:hypothetical protein
VTPSPLTSLLLLEVGVVEVGMAVVAVLVVTETSPHKS